MKSTRALVAIAAIPALLAAQASEPRGAVPDARTIPAGAVRIGLGASWDRMPEEYRDGKLRGIGSRFSFDTIGPAQVGIVGAAESLTRTASGLPDFRAWLGRSVVKARLMREESPFSLEYGLTSRVTVGASIPFVTATSWVDIRMNPLGREATVGINPTYLGSAVAPGYNAFYLQLDSARAFVQQRLTSCQAQPASSGCAAILANPDAARVLVQQSTAYADALAQLYGGRVGGTRGWTFVPVAGSAAQAAVEARLAGFKAQYAAFSAPAITASAPQGAAPLTAAAFQSVLHDSAYGIIANPLGQVIRRGFGNAELNAQALLIDQRARGDRDGTWRARTWWRIGVAGAWRPGRTDDQSAADLLSLPLGGAGSLSASATVDAGVGSRGSLTTRVSMTSFQASTAMMRLRAAPTDPFPEAFRTASVSVTPGAITAVELYPRWVFSEAVTANGFYSHRSAAHDTWSGHITGPVPAGTNGTFDASVLGAATGGTESRLGASLSYSTVAAWERGQASWPIELMVRHWQTTAGAGALVAKSRYDDVQLRWYWRLKRR